MKAQRSVFSFENFRLHDHEFALLRDLIHEISGINLEQHKRELLRMRLLNRVRQLQLNSFKEYYEYVVNSDPDKEEREELLNAVSTNKTDFFREIAHFDFLRNKALPDLCKKSPLRILSAGCSTGEEPYSIAITCYDFFGEKTNASVSLYAIDLNTQVLAKANEGIYPLDAVSMVPKERLHQYFLQGTGEFEGKVQLKPDIKNLVDFRCHNLMAPLPFNSKFHIIFCRNVVIYFDRATQKNLFQRFQNSLLPGGYLFIGHSESLSFFEHSLRYIQPSVYKNEQL